MLGWYILFGGSAARAFGRGAAAVSVSLAALIIVPIGVVQIGPALFAPALIPLAILVAILSAVLPFSLELYALPRLPARSFAVLTCLEPAFACVFGLLMLGEVLGLVQTVGVALVITASMGAVWGGARRGSQPIRLRDRCAGGC